LRAPTEPAHFTLGYHLIALAGLKALGFNPIRIHQTLPKAQIVLQAFRHG